MKNRNTRFGKKECSNSEDESDSKEDVCSDNESNVCSGSENESDCEFISNSKFWLHIETKALLSFFAKNFDLYRKK